MKPEQEIGKRTKQSERATQEGMDIEKERKV